MEGSCKRCKIDPYLRKIPFKVCSADRTIRKGVVSSGFWDLIGTCIEKFNTGSYDVRLVLNEDGTEIDEDYFEILEPNTVLVLLRQKEVWTPEDVAREPIETSPEKVKVKKPQDVTCVVGWKHYNVGDKKYQLQKSTTENPSSGQKIIKLPKSFGYDETLKYFTDLFFKDGKNEQGNLNRMRCSLGNSKDEEVSDSNFSLGAFAESCGTKTTRIYLFTKPQYPLRRRSSGSYPDTEVHLPRQHSFEPKPGMSPASALGRPAIGTCSSVSALPVIALQTYVKPTDRVTPSPVKVQTASSGTAKKKCPMCFKRDRDAFIMPCGDSICMTCGTQLKAYGEGCPTCRGPVQQVRLIF